MIITHNGKSSVCNAKRNSRGRPLDPGVRLLRLAKMTLSRRRPCCRKRNDEEKK